jgi:hypothetical protein
MMVSEDMKVDGLIVRSGNEYGHADGNGHESEIRAFLRIRTLLEPAPVSLALARVCRHLHWRPTLALDMALSVSRGPPSSSGAVACHSRRWLCSTLCQLDFKTILEDGRTFLPAERFFVRGLSSPTPPATSLLDSINHALVSASCIHGSSNLGGDIRLRPRTLQPSSTRYAHLLARYVNLRTLSLKVRVEGY